MPILNIQTSQAGLTGVLPAVAYINTSDTEAQVLATGYLNQSVQSGLASFSMPCIAAVTTVASAGATPDVGWYEVHYSAGNWSLVATVSPGDVILPTVANALAVFSNTAGTLTDNLNNATNAGSTTSATPGTIRSLIGKMSGTATAMTSGNLVGVRGEVDYVGASGGFLYGVQGKLIPTGTLSGSSWNAGVFGQLDISGATINAGQTAPIWGDYGTTSGTLTSETGMYGIAMTNTTAAVLAGQLYLYGGATNLMLLDTNAGLSGTTYFKTSGTSAGSWGNATPPTPSKVLQISVDGTLYYLPLVAQNT